MTNMYWSNRASINSPVSMMEIDGSDHFLSRIECNSGAPPWSYNGSINVTGPNLYVAGLWLKGSHNFLRDCIGEYSDVGIKVDGHLNILQGCRADSNGGIGYVINGQYNTLTGCNANHNSGASVGAYDGFQCAGYGNTFTGCLSLGGDVGSSGTTIRYGYYDTNTDATNPNVYDNCRGFNYQSGLFGFGAGSTAAVRQPNIGASLTGTGDVSVDVSVASFLDTSSMSTPARIINLTGGGPNQQVRILGKSGVSIANNANIKTSSGSDLSLSANTVITANKISGIWYV